MRKAWKRVRGVVLHPAVTLTSNAVFIGGMGVFVASLIGGALAVVLEFPLGFLILSGVGAFLATVGGLRMLLPPPAQPQADSQPSGFWTDAMRQGQLQEEEDRKRNLRQSLQLVRGAIQYKTM